MVSPGDTAFHIVLAPVYRPRPLRRMFSGRNVFLRFHWVIFGEGIEVDTLLVEGNRISGWEIEHHDVVAFYLADSLQSPVFPLRLVDVRFASD